MPEASSNIDYATGTSPTADVQQDIWQLSAEDATAVLEARAADFRPPPAPLTPTNAREADMRLQQLINDPEWARKLMNGDIATRNEFQKLSELKVSGGIGDDVANEPLVETTIGDTGLSRRNLISAAEDMRRDQFSEEAIHHILSDGKFDADTVATAQYYLPRMERDPSLLCPDLPADRDYQMKVFRTIAAIGTGDW
jgi:hypothetical protein